MTKNSPDQPVDHTRVSYEISTDPERLDLDVIHHYLSEQSYWARGISRERVARSIRHSLCFGVYTADQAAPGQVGFARVVTDFVSFAYLADVFIRPDYQGQGLGKWLVSYIVGHPDLQAVRRWALYTKDAHELYRRFGFDAAPDPGRYMIYRPHADESAISISERI